MVLREQLSMQAASLHGCTDQCQMFQIVSKTDLNHKKSVQISYTMIRVQIPVVFPKRQMLNSSKMKEFADDNFKFDENVREFFIREKNTAGKGEISRYEQFLLFPQCFQKKKSSAGT